MQNLVLDLNALAVETFTVNEGASTDEQLDASGVSVLVVCDTGCC